MIVRMANTLGFACDVATGGQQAIDKVRARGMPSTGPGATAGSAPAASAAAAAAAAAAATNTHSSSRSSSSVDLTSGSGSTNSATMSQNAFAVSLGTAPYTLILMVMNSRCVARHSPVTRHSAARFFPTSHSLGCFVCCAVSPSVRCA